jgi:predicted metalloprotease
MRWEGQRESGNIEDRRSMGPARIGGGLGIVGIVLVLAVSYFTGINPVTLINMLNGVQEITDSSAPSEPAPTGSPNDQLGKFASVVLADTETTWRQLLGPRYEEPHRLQSVPSTAPATTKSISTSPSST